MLSATHTTNLLVGSDY